MSYHSGDQVFECLERSGVKLVTDNASQVDRHQRDQIVILQICRRVLEFERLKGRL
jgi:hypothetical protein